MFVSVHILIVLLKHPLRCKRALAERAAERLAAATVARSLDAGSRGGGERRRHAAGAVERERELIGCKRRGCKLRAACRPPSTSLISIASLALRASSLSALSDEASRSSRRRRFAFAAASALDGRFGSRTAPSDLQKARVLRASSRALNSFQHRRAAASLQKRAFRTTR